MATQYSLITLSLKLPVERTWFLENLVLANILSILGLILTKNISLISFFKIMAWKDKAKADFPSLKESNVCYIYNQSAVFKSVFLCIYSSH